MELYRALCMTCCVPPVARGDTLALRPLACASENGESGGEVHFSEWTVCALSVRNNASCADSTLQEWGIPQR